MIKTLGVFLTFAALPALAQYPRTIGWNGETWMVKKSTGKVGPGPNYFSDSANNIWVDGNNKLHLEDNQVRQPVAVRRSDSCDLLWPRRVSLLY
jgi:hypothetical protein